MWWMLCPALPPPPPHTHTIFPSTNLPPYCFSLGPWQHPSRWRVYFCFCLFTYSWIQLFGASQGLSFHHRMQIATATNPLSSLPCRHPTSLHVSPRLLQSGHLSFFQGMGSGLQWPGQPASNTCVYHMHVKHKTPFTSHPPFTSWEHSALPPHFPFLPPCWPWRHTGARSSSKVVDALPFSLEWRAVGASLIELGRTWEGLLIKLLQ